MKLMNETASLGKILATARRRCQLTQQELCAETGIAYSTLTKIERGAIKKPNVFTVFKIAQATNLSVEDLLENKTSPSTEKKTAAVVEQPPPVVERKPSTPDLVRFIYFDLHQVMVLISGLQQCQLAAIKLRTTPALIEHLKLSYEKRLLTGQVSLREFDRIICRQTKQMDFSWRDLYLQVIRANPVIQNLAATLNNQTSIGLLTNAFEGNVSALLAAKKLPDIFKVIVDSSETGLLKPQPEIYDRAQKLANVPPSEILLIDDHPVNILAAQEMGWRAYRYRPNGKQKLKEDFSRLFNFEH